MANKRSKIGFKNVRLRKQVIKPKQASFEKVITNKHGVNLPYSLVKEGEKYANVVNKKRSKKRGYIQQKPYIRAVKGVYTEVTSGERMDLRAKKYNGETPFQELNSINFNLDAMKDVQQAKRKVKMLKDMSTSKYERRKNKIYKQSLIKSIDSKYGNLGSPEFLEGLKDKIAKMSAKELVEFMYTTEALNIDFVYGNPETEENFKIFVDTVNEMYETKYKK